MKSLADKISIPDRDDIHLCLVNANDAEVLYPIIDENREFLQQYQDWAKDITPDKLSEMIAKNLEYTEGGKFLQYRIIEGTAQDESIVGTVTFYDLDIDKKSTKLGFWLIESAQGRGYATSSIQALIDYGRKAWNLEAVYMEIEPDNTKSQHLAERLNAQKTDETTEEEWYGRLVKADLWKIEVAQ